TFYRDLPMEDESVIRELLLSTLALFLGQDSSPEDLKTYLEHEKEYFLTASANELWTRDSLPELLAERALYLDSYPSPGLLRRDTSSGLSSQEIRSEFLNQYAYNMNARSYVTNPAIGRDQEIEDLALILISPKKSPILLGEAGVGKTSVVEGLAYALQQGKAPTLLKDKKIFKLTTTSLLSGTKYVGEMEERMKKLMEELAKFPDVILFIDEIHTVVGAGSTESSHNDIANMLKPYIDRGDIKIIGATTTREYQRFIKYDQALSRRFYPILVEEPGHDLCMEILEGSIPSISQATRVNNPFSEEETRRFLTILLDISLPDNQPEDLKTRWPELPLSLLEMAFSYAALASRDSLREEDFIRAVAHSNRLKNSVKKDAGKYFVV
ncbi:MAG: ATP-dependent Clp protease ATP-binding subunit, partial [Eubacterium sp.]|nr:ATP-dependent Clp protease ATP-binding subunit [Eubacterium sp.]